MTDPYPSVGTELAATNRALDRALDAALAAGGGTRPTWLVLRALLASPRANQRELAAAVGIQDATLTHHLNAMEAGGLVTRRRDPGNRRVHLVAPTAAGEELLGRLDELAAAHEQRIRAGFEQDELGALRRLLGRLRENAGDGLAGLPPRDVGRRPSDTERD